MVKSAFRFAVALCMLAASSAAQDSAKRDDAKELYLKAVKLIEAGGGRERFSASLPTMIEEGKAAMRKQCPDCSDAFVAEWGKRMGERLKADPFVDVAAKAYAKRFTADELNELTAFVTSQKTDKPIALAPALQKKIADVLPSLMGEVTGGSTEIGATVGRQIAEEIEKEHLQDTRPKERTGKP